MKNRKTYKENLKDIIDINSEVDWLKCRGDIDGYLLYSDMNTNKYLLLLVYLITMRFGMSVTMMQCTQTTDSLVNLL